jgi:hypothetical protein
MNLWIERVKVGDFSAIPERLDFVSSSAFAHLIDGYGLTGGVSECAKVSRKVLESKKRGKRVRATALDLWIALFFAYRACRHCDDTPTGARLLFFNRLLAELRAALVALTPSQKVGILAAMTDRPIGSLQSGRKR